MFEDPTAGQDIGVKFLQSFNAASENSARKQQLANQERTFGLEQQKLAQQQAIMQIGSEAARTGNPIAIARYSALNPEGGKALLDAHKVYTDEAQGLLQGIEGSKITDRPAVYKMNLAKLAKIPSFDISNYPEEYDPNIVNPIVSSDLIATRDRSKSYTSQETAQGLQAFDPTTGKLTPTGAGVYQKPPSTLVNVNNIAEKAYDNATGKGLGDSDVKFYQDISDRADKARNQSSTLDAVENSLDTIGKTGKFTTMGAVIINAASQAGFDVDKKKLANIEAARGELNKLVLPETKTLGTGNGFTDKDREFLSQTFPQITDSYQGNKLKIQLARKVNQRQIEVGEFADTLREEGRNPFEIRKAIAQKYKNQPVFTKEDFKLAKNPNEVNNTTDYSEEDINHTAKIHGLTPDEVRRRLAK